MKLGKVDLWSAISVLPPVFLGLAGSLILALEGRILEVILVLVLVAMHRYSAVLLRRGSLTSDQRMDWMGVRILTTVSCFALPFFLAFTIH